MLNHEDSTMLRRIAVAAEEILEILRCLGEERTPKVNEKLDGTNAGLIVRLEDAVADRSREVK